MDIFFIPMRLKRPEIQLLQGGMILRREDTMIWPKMDVPLFQVLEKNRMNSMYLKCPKYRKKTLEIMQICTLSISTMYIYIY